MQRTLLGVLVLFILLNLILLVSNASLSTALRALERRAREAGEKKLEAQLASLRKEVAGVAAERARLSLKIDGLEEAIVRLRPDEPSGEPAHEGTREAPSAPLEADSVEGAEKIDPFKIVLLSAEEKSVLLRKRDALPALRPSDGTLIEGDVDAVLKDPGWNPGNQTLNDAQRRELGGVLRNYKYFARESIVERADGVMKREMEKMDEAGAYVEYGAGAPKAMPPSVVVGDVLVISASGPAESPEFRRLYYFYPQDYPSLYHQRQVEQERSLECYVKAYELINGPLQPAGTQSGEVKEVDG